MPQMTVIEAVRSAIRQEMMKDPSVFILGEDIGYRGGVFLATDGLLDEFGESRVIDTPLAESSIAGIALGAAVNGMRPIAEIQFADFVWPAINQLIGEASRVRYGTNGRKSAPLTIRIPYGGGVRGGLYHSQSVEVLFAHTPGLKVVAPATPYDAKGLLASSIRSNDPTIFLEHKKTYRLVRGEVPKDEYLEKIGSAEIKRGGSDLTVITYGLMLHYCLQAADILSETEGFETLILDLRTLRPLDQNAIIKAASHTGKVLIVQEDTPVVSISSEVAAIISENSFYDLDAPITRLTPPDFPPMPFSPVQEAAFMPSTDSILDAMKKLALL